MSDSVVYTQEEADALVGEGWRVITHHDGTGDRPTQSWLLRSPDDTDDESP